MKGRDRESERARQSHKQKVGWKEGRKERPGTRGKRERERERALGHGGVCPARFGLDQPQNLLNLKLVLTTLPLLQACKRDLRSQI